MNEEVNSTEIKRGGSKKIWLLIIFGIIILFGGAFYYFGANKKATPVTDTVTTTESSQTTEQAQKATKFWSEGQVAIAGNYADAEVVDLGDGQYRMYYSIEPEVQGNKLEMYSAISSDGVTWTKEDGERKKMSTFPDAVKLADGTWRMYFQNAGVIKSATSTDGLKLTDEAGVRINSTETGFNIENAGAPTTMQLADGTYIMVYRGLVNQKYAPNVPNQSTGLFFYATSSDGLTWEKKGLALDSRNATLKGWVDGPEWVKWSDNETRLYFWSYEGDYYITYEDGSFSTEPVLDFAVKKDPMIQFAPNPPGDPTLVKIKDQWFMYYGQHEKGIYYTTLR